MIIKAYGLPATTPMEFLHYNRGTQVLTCSKYPVLSGNLIPLEWKHICLSLLDDMHHHLTFLPVHSNSLMHFTNLHFHLITQRLCMTTPDRTK